MSLLQFRLNLFYNSVDHFIVLDFYTEESEYIKNRDLFSEFDDKIIRIDCKSKNNLGEKLFNRIKKVLPKLKLSYNDIIFLSKINQFPDFSNLDEIETKLIFDCAYLLQLDKNKKNYSGDECYEIGSTVFYYSQILMNHKLLNFFLKDKKNRNKYSEEIVKNGFVLKDIRKRRKTIKVDLDKINKVEFPKIPFYESENFHLEYSINELKKEIYKQNPIDRDKIVFYKKITSIEVIWKQIKNKSIYEFIKKII